MDAQVKGDFLSPTALPFSFFLLPFTNRVNVTPLLASPPLVRRRDQARGRALDCVT